MAQYGALYSSVNHYENCSKVSYLIYYYFNLFFRSEDEQISEAKDFWLKYWVVFAHYYLIEYFADCFVSWVPFYSEVLIWYLKLI